MTDNLSPATTRGTHPLSSPPKRRISFRWRLVFTGLLAGLLAGLVSVVCMLTLRLTAGIPTPVELFGDFVLKRLTAPRFVDMLIFFSPNSKTVPLGLTFLAMIALGTLTGPLYAIVVRLRPPVAGLRPGLREWLSMLLLGVALSLVGSVLFWTELRQNFLGLPVAWAILASVSGLFLDFEIYALVLGWSYRALLPRLPKESETRAGQSRRTLMTRTGIAVLGIGSTGAALGL